MSGNKVTALVTGASAGIGEQFCRQLAARCDVILAVARRAERLEALAQELSGQAEVHAIEADLTTVEGVTRVLEALRQKGPVDYLINNAGFATVGNFADLDVDSQRAMVNLHIDATITLSRAAIPFMRERGGGAIINVSSVGAMLPSRGIAVYAATKAFLNTFSLSLQDELGGTGIKVQALCPGYTRTEFHDVMQQHGFDPDRVPAAAWMTPEAVVSESLAALEHDEVVVVTGEINRELARGGLQLQLDALN